MAVVAFCGGRVRHRPAGHPRLGRRRPGRGVRRQGPAGLGERVARAADGRRGQVATAPRHHGRPARPATAGDLQRRPDLAGDAGPGRTGRLLLQVPAAAAAGRHRAARGRACDSARRPALGGGRGPHSAADPALHGPGGLDDRGRHPQALGGADPARQPLRRPDRRPADPAGVRTGESPGRRAAAQRDPAPLRDHAHAAGVVPLRAGARTAGDPVGGDHRRHDRLPGRLRGARPHHRPVRPDPGPRGVPAGAPGRRALPRRRRRAGGRRAGLRRDRRTGGRRSSPRHGGGRAGRPPFVGIRARPVRRGGAGAVGARPHPQLCRDGGSRAGPGVLRHRPRRGGRAGRRQRGRQDHAAERRDGLPHPHRRPGAHRRRTDRRRRGLATPGGVGRAVARPGLRHGRRQRRARLPGSRRGRDRRGPRAGGRRCAAPVPARRGRRRGRLGRRAAPDRGRPGAAAGTPRRHLAARAGRAHRGPRHRHRGRAAGEPARAGRRRAGGEPPPGRAGRGRPGRPDRSRRNPVRTSPEPVRTNPEPVEGSPNRGFDCSSVR